jgi:plastocyanin
MTELRKRRRRLLLRGVSVGLLAAALVGVGAVNGLAAEPTIEATGSSFADYAWSPSSAEVSGGGAVTFKNPTAIPHGLAWESGPETPSCTGTSSVGKANWSGSCTFGEGGSYAFYCPVHPGQMRGTITVDGPAAPVVSTGSASAVSETEATLNGTVNPSGQEASYYFEYGTTTAYGSKTDEAPAGEGTAAAARSASVSGLAPGTTYHFRIVAENATGTKRGADRTFKTTGGAPVEPPPPPDPQPTEPQPTLSFVPPSSPSSSPAPTVPSSGGAPPETVITLKPRAKTNDRTPTVKFKASIAGASYKCSVDGKPFKPCRSPFTTPLLKPGRHTIRVEAASDGVTDPTPAVCSFKVVGKK